MRRGPETYCGSLTGDLKRGRAAAPLLVVLRYPPSRGGTTGGPVAVWVCATGRLGRRDGRDAQSTGRPTGRPFFCRSTCPFRTCLLGPTVWFVFEPSEVISYFEMCREEGSSLQRGMNYRLRGGDSVVLMSRRPGAPYADRVEDEGRVLIYEGHDTARRLGEPDPKTRDQPLTTDTGAPTQNALFFSAAKRHAASGAEPERVRVYEKLRQGIGSSTASSASSTLGRRRATTGRSSSSDSNSTQKAQAIRCSSERRSSRRASFRLQ
jgi:hypothetical protein